jgi:hypothetical protein
MPCGGFYTNYVSLIKDMFNNVMSSIQRGCDIGWGPSLKTCLLALEMNTYKEICLGTFFLLMDVVLAIDKKWLGVNNKLDLW